MPSQPSQDLEARFSVFLNPIRDLTKNWEVDIAKYLEDYLVELSEIQITFDGGVTVMNFAEAAMLIQGSATVYSKKVEFLWQMVLQMLDLLSSKRNLDTDNESSQKTGGTGRSSKNSSILNFERVDKMPIGKNINLKVEDEAEDKKTEFKFLPAVPLHLVEKESEKSTMHITLYLKNKEPFGNKDDYRINRCYLAPSGLLCLDLPHEFLQQNLGQRLADKQNDSVAGFFNNSILDEAGAPNEEAVPNVELAEDDVDHGGGIENNEEFEHMEVDAQFDPDPGDLPAENPVLNGEGIEPPEDVEPLVEDPNAVDEEQRKEDAVITINGRYGLRKKDPKEKVADIDKLKDPLKPLDPHIETPARRPVRAGRLRKPLPCTCHKEMFKKNSRRTRSKALKEVDNLAAKTISVEEFITKDLARLIANNNNNNSDPKLGLNVNPKLIQEFANENKKKQEKVKKNRLKGDTNENGELDDENDIEHAGMAAVDGDDNVDFNDDDAVPNIDFENIGDGDNFDLPEPHQNNEIETPFGLIRIGDEESDGNSNRTLNDSMLYEPGSEYEALVQKWVSEYIANAQEHVISSDLVKRVNRWRKTITPKLAEEEDRKAFDIHEYGSRILSHFPADSDGGQVPFAEVAKHEDHREVSRIFLSCLMLANTYNIHLSNTIEGPLQMDCLQLKLLSRVRHHQELDEAAGSRQQAHAQAISPTDKRSSPVNRNRKKRRRKTVVSSGGDSGSASEECSDDVYVPNMDPSGSSGSDINCNRQSNSRRSPKGVSSKKLKTLSENR